jgi:hypothetical protein
MIKAINNARSFATFHSRIAVIGAGAGGHHFVSNAIRQTHGVIQPSDITVFDPATTHAY